MAFYQVAFTRSDTTEVHLDEVLHGFPLPNQLPVEGIEPGPEVYHLNLRVTSIEEFINKVPGANRIEIKSFKWIGKFIPQISCTRNQNNTKKLDLTMIKIIITFKLYPQS